MVRTMFLSAALILASSVSVQSAETPPAGDALPGADLFKGGWKFDQGIGTPIDIPAAMRWYRNAAAVGNPLAKARLARIYFSGNGVVVNKTEAERLSKGIYADVMKAAEKNDAVAQMTVGCMLIDGLGVARDGAEGLKWLRKAADQNLAPAQANLAVAYENGEGVDRDVFEAVKWYRKAAAQNNAQAQAYLGDFYLRGEGVEQSDYKAAQLFRQSAAQNFPHGLTNLGYLYEHGCGVPVNEAEGIRLYRLAAEQHFGVAEFNLGVAYEDGCGVPQNFSAAVTWYSRAAKQGDPSAIRALRRLGYQP